MLFSSTSYPIWLLPVFVSCLAIYNILRLGRREKGLPPGPPTIPILGNAHQIPSTGLHLKLEEWGRKYGEIYSLKLGSATWIVLNSRRAVHDLVDKRATIYNDRVHDYNLQLATDGKIFAFEDANAKWRSQRKITSQNLSPRALDEKIAPIQEAEIGQLLYELLESPEEFSTHVRRATGSTISIVVYGQRGPSMENFWANYIYRVMDKLNPAMEAGSCPPVDQFPILRYIPERWAPWKTRCKEGREAMYGLYQEARELVETRRRNGDERNSIVDRLLSGTIKQDVKLDYHEFNCFLGTIAQAGADTTAHATLTNILMLTLHPEFQRRAQHEIDRVCGMRMPVWSDFHDLRYVNCIIKEGQRWHSVIPNGVVRRANREDWYDGFRIPKDSAIVLTAYSLHRNSYDQPNIYNPDRFIDHPKLAMDYAGSPDYMNRDKSPILSTYRPIEMMNCLANISCSHHYGYGSGRRICAGIHLAERAQWRMVAKILWAYNIEPAIDQATGEPQKLDPHAYVQGMLHGPLPFKVNFVPRSKEHEQIVKRDYEASKGFLQEWE
ncbi:cytochrome P450 [Pseudovirgaria hyperparasitica]|uniref:Cytochrome P450 n=1 Tax=Pseudovirgaria hyperparasitica TaxID=470096 RepID=A0A6A6VQ77_9PEZI|nr:cytochrome P450 [Pseudovirgaria hyperparasitica]KAF2752798.1 cytochrome P450 [Pseudovirgaria hyperparasitica]